MASPAIWCNIESIIIRNGLALMFEDPSDLYLADLESEKSRATMRRALTYFAQFMNSDPKATIYSIRWRDIQCVDVQRFKRYLIDKKAPGQTDKTLSANTVALYLAAIRGALQKAHTSSTVSPDNKVSYEVLSEIAVNLKSPKIDKSIKGRYIEPRTFNELISGLSGKKKEISRDRAIMSILYGCGLRCSELCDLSYPEDINWEDSSLNVLGKGGKLRDVPMYSDVEEAIEEWLFHRGEKPGPLFLPISKTDNVLYREGEHTDPVSGKIIKREIRSITTHGVSKLLKKACLRTGIKVYKPHDFRRSYITTLFYLETDLLTIQKLVGHNSAETTRRYDLRDYRAGKSAAIALGDLLKDS